MLASATSTRGGRTRRRNFASDRQGALGEFAEAEMAFTAGVEEGLKVNKAWYPALRRKRIKPFLRQLDTMTNNQNTGATGTDRGDNDKPQPSHALNIDVLPVSMCRFTPAISFSSRPVITLITFPSPRITVQKLRNPGQTSHSAECAPSTTAVDFGHIRQHIFPNFESGNKRETLKEENSISFLAGHGRVQHPVKKSYQINQRQGERMVTRYQKYKDRGEIDLYLRTLRAKDKSRIEAAHIKFLRSTLGVTRRDRLRNKDIRNQLQQEDMVEEIQRYQKQWKEHVLRMSPSRLPRQAFFTDHLEAETLGDRLCIYIVVYEGSAINIKKDIFNGNVRKLTPLESQQQKISIFTDSRITLDSLRNKTNHTHLIEEIRREVKEAERKKWKIEFNWIKAHAGHEGNELADQLAKEAARSEDIPESYSKTPKSAVKGEIHTLSLVKWQNEWDNTAKGQITKSFFPNINDRLKLKLNITPNFTTIITGHGNIKSYLHKYKIIDSPLCPCNNDEQTIDHLLYNCKLLEREKDILKAAVLKSENWPVNKDKLVHKYQKNLIKFTNNIQFDKLQ
ncbi:hypothetical protein ANN_26592 [Periplaneta americana]|uniref:RNase H type-1 domain-containing protein n=1 Tax=Periplaneta americana TaxID=6978 RepID=A0ABQ8RYH7_PERAM|nr:hypothetical protein ANN_26592 [Periplaneta americana]